MLKEKAGGLGASSTPAKPSPQGERTKTMAENEELLRVYNRLDYFLEIFEPSLSMLL